MNSGTKVAISVRGLARWWIVLALGWVELGAAETTATGPRAADLGWLAGTWVLERGGRTVTERWGTPAGGMLLGTSHTVAGDRTVEYEFSVIRPGADGRLEYAASPSGQPRGVFPLKESGPRFLLFENLQHDFPQRIRYELRPDGTLLAAIEGTRGGKERRIEFPYRRAPQPAAP